MVGDKNLAERARNIMILLILNDTVSAFTPMNTKSELEITSALISFLAMRGSTLELAVNLLVFVLPKHNHNIFLALAFSYTSKLFKRHA